MSKATEGDVEVTRGRQALGREGEARAARFLESRGYQIVARNVRAERVEIDLVASRGERLVFVEVKTRRASARGGYGRHASAAEAVDPRKQARLRRGALAWLGAHPGLRRRFGSVRFDVVTCLAPPWNATTASSGEARWSIEHWPAAFQ
jgi:putative endonuclease